MSFLVHHRRQARLIIFIILFVGLMLALRDNDKVEIMVAAIHDAGPLPFFAGMTLLPLIGFPVTPFYLLGGAVFGDWQALLVTAISLIVNLLLSYAIATRWMRSHLTNLLKRRGRRLPDIAGRNVWLYTIAIRLAPGPSLSMKNYLIALAKVPMSAYLIVSMPITLAYAATLIIVGDSLIDRHWSGMLIGILLLAVFSIIVAVSRSRLHARNVVEPEELE